MKTLIFALFAIIGTSSISYSQDLLENNKLSQLSFYVAVNNEFVNPQGNKVRSHNSAGLELGLQVKENYNIGIFHLFSYSPNDLWSEKNANSDELKILQYGLNLFYREKVTNIFYWQGGARIAVGDFRQMYKDENNCDCPDRLKTSDSFKSILLSPDIKLGVKVFDWFSIETGFTYRLAFGNNEKWSIHANDFEGLGTTISLKGSF